MVVTHGPLPASPKIGWWNARPLMQQTLLKPWTEHPSMPLTLQFCWKMCENLFPWKTKTSKYYVYHSQIHNRKETRDTNTNQSRMQWASSMATMARWCLSGCCENIALHWRCMVVSGAIKTIVKENCGYCTFSFTADLPTHWNDSSLQQFLEWGQHGMHGLILAPHHWGKQPIHYSMFKYSSNW